VRPREARLFLVWPDHVGYGHECVSGGSTEVFWFFSSEKTIFSKKEERFLTQKNAYNGALDLAGWT
jgi:hypothetical protein